MTSTPMAANTTATQVNVFISQIEAIIVPVIENALVTGCPTLGLPIIKQITDDVVQALADEITKLAQEGATFVVINLQTGAEVSAVSKELAAVIAAEKGGNPDEIKAAIQAYATATSSLDHSDGSATPTA